MGYTVLASKQGIREVDHEVRMAERHGDVQKDLNPIAHRKAKIVYNFGLSECSRVNFICYSYHQILDELILYFS